MFDDHLLINDCGCAFAGQEWHASPGYSAPQVVAMIERARPRGSRKPPPRHAWRAGPSLKRCSPL